MNTVEIKEEQGVMCTEEICQSGFTAFVGYRLPGNSDDKDMWLIDRSSSSILRASDICINYGNAEFCVMRFCDVKIIEV